MRENIKMRLSGLVFLGMMMLFVSVHLLSTEFITKILSLVTSGVWLIAFLITQYHVLKLELKRKKKC